MYVCDTWKKKDKVTCSFDSRSQTEVIGFPEGQITITRECVEEHMGAFDQLRSYIDMVRQEMEGESVQVEEVKPIKPCGKGKK